MEKQASRGHKGAAALALPDQARRHAAHSRLFSSISVRGPAIPFSSYTDKCFQYCHEMFQDIRSPSNAVGWKQRRSQCPGSNGQLHLYEDLSLREGFAVRFCLCLLYPKQPLGVKQLGSKGDFPARTELYASLRDLG